MKPNCFGENKVFFFLTNNDKDKANTLSDFFSSVFTTETTDNYPSLEDINISYNMGTLVIDEEKVKKRLHELNISKSPGPDGLHPRILHDLYEELGKPIAIIFKNSMENKNIALSLSLLVRVSTPFSLFIIKSDIPILVFVLDFVYNSENQ
jgi:hypothetical protein